MTRTVRTLENRRAFERKGALVALPVGRFFKSRDVQDRFYAAVLTLHALLEARAARRPLIARLHARALDRRLDVLTEVCAKQQPVLVREVNGGRAGLRELLRLLVGDHLARELGDSKMAQDAAAAIAKLAFRAPIPPAFRDLYASLGLRRPRGAPPGVTTLGESRDEAEAAIRAAIRAVHRKGYRLTKTAIGTKLGSIRTLDRTVDLWQIDLDALRREVRDPRTAALRRREPT